MPHLEDEEQPTADASPVETAAESSRRPVGGRPSAQWFLRIGLEVILISVGVFLALMGEQWRENAHHRELAADSLRRFRVEIETNRKGIAAVKDYHVGLLKSIRTYLTRPRRTARTIQ